MSALLEMRGIVRCFGAVRANDGIDLEVRSGEILGLLGENGSGKSTLMKVLFGMTAPDSGEIVFRGRALSGHRPAEAMAAGIAMIHQHFMLIEAMSVVENVMLGWPSAGRVLKRAEIAARVSEVSQRFGLDLKPDAMIASLPLGRRQRVEILKAALRDAELLILDEPTSNLAPTEVADLLVDPSPPARGRQRDRVHQPQAAGSARCLRPGRRAAQWPRLGSRRRLAA